MNTDLFSPSGSPNQVVQALQRQVDELCEGSLRPGGAQAAGESVSSGCQALDNRLPAQGFRRGSLVEWLSEQPGSGAEILSLLAAREAMQTGGALVVLDRAGQFYPPAAASWGIDLTQLVLVRAADERKERWAWDQALRCRGVVAVWGLLERLDDRWFRRFQLAAKSSGCLGLLLRPNHVRGEPSWSEVQLQVRPRCARVGRRMQVELVRCRGQGGPGAVELELDELTGELREVKSWNHETSTLHLASQLAHPATRRRSTRA